VRERRWGGGGMYNVEVKKVFNDVFQLNIKVIQDAVKTVYINIIVSKIMFIHYFSKYSTSMNLDMICFLFIPLALGFVETCRHV
jgi:hypothetical protein